MNAFKKVFKVLLILTLTGTILGGALVAGAYYYLNPKLPSIDSLKDIQLQVPLRIYSKDALLISEYGEKRRIPLKFEEVPTKMVQAFLAAEDDRFYEHPGVDYQGLLRAAFQLALTGKKSQGGSTITMQVARNFFLSKKKTYLRKVNEIFLALKINRDLTKNEVLTLYLNKIYLGHSAYGVGAAAQIYYGKTVDELSLPEIAMIAGLPKAPSSYNPITNSDRALLRRNYVLNRMLSLNYISQEEQISAINTPVTAQKHAANIQLHAPYIAEMARAEVFERFGPEIYSGGYSVYTTVTADFQQKAIDAVHLVCNEYDQRHGYRGPINLLDKTILSDSALMNQKISETPTVGNLLPGIVTDVREKEIDVYLSDEQIITIPWQGLKWARSYITEDKRAASPKTAIEITQPAALIYVLKENSIDDENNLVENWRLAQKPDVSSALVSLNPQDGAINALVGGYDYFENKFNRATQAKRQPGSGFKAFVYSAALENGFTAASLINDAPVVFEDSGLEQAWRPENYSGKFFGLTRLRYALTKSRNLVSVRLLRSMGVNKALSHIQNFGFSKEDLPHNLSLALGSANVTPLQMARGYSVLSNGGYLIDPYLISRIDKNNQGTIFEATPKTVCADCESLQTEPPLIEVSQENLTTDTISEEKIPEYAPRVISKENRFIMYSMMQDVITRGTAKRAKTLKREDLAGKTGTTNEQRDAWFNGYNQSIVTNIWVGFDNNKKLGRGEVGGKAALPGWIHFMEAALAYYPEDNPPSMPEGMLNIRIDPKTGKLASIDQKDAIFEVFRAENAPTERANITSIINPSAAENPTDSAQTPTLDEDLF